MSFSDPLSAPSEQVAPTAKSCLRLTMKIIHR
jgi:hypothetical protein